MKPLSLRALLTLSYTGALIAILTALGVGYHAALVRQLEAAATANLDEKARGLHGFLRFPDGMPVIEYDQADPEALAFVNDVTRYYQVYNARTGQLLFQSPGLEALGLHYTAAEVAEFRARPGIVDLQTERGRLRLMSTVIVPAAGDVYLIQVGELLDTLDRTLVGFDRTLVWRIVAGLALAMAAGYWLAGRALAPLARLARTTQSIGITNLNERLALRGNGDELDQVASAFNRALASVEQSVGEMRQFSAALAHELRTPLAVLRGEAELALRRHSNADELRATLADQIDEFDRLTRLINQILTLARAEGGEISIATEPVDLSVLAAGVVEQIEPVADARGVHLRCEAGEPVWVRGDNGWLERLLLILLDNAIKFTPPDGEVSVVVARSNEFAVLAVSDSGEGIAPAAMPHLFERFYRGESARSRTSEGAGLGLALAKWIAEQHRGAIDVHSSPARGATFSVRLPAVSAPDIAT